MDDGAQEKSSALGHSVAVLQENSELSFVRALHGAFEVNERIPSVMNQRRIDSAVSTEMHLL